jgi:hypothetical protein
MKPYDVVKRHLKILNGDNCILEGLKFAIMESFLCLSLLHNVKMTYALEHVMLFVSNNNIISSYITIILYDHHN